MKRQILGLVAVLPAISVGTAAQNLATSLNRIEDGFVRMSFAAREGVCGNGGGITTWRTNDAHWEPDCEPGPVRVVIERRAGDVEDIDTHVGGRWREHADVIDLGEVPAQEAAEYLISLARHPDEDVAKDAVGAAALADVPRLWTDMMAMARDESFGLAVRKTALFWSGHLGDESVVGMLVGFIRADVHPDLRESAVFALSQQGSESAASALQDIAEDSGEVSTLRERAIFWLGQRRTESHEYLRELYQSIGDPELKERIIFAVSQRATDEDWEWLIERAASGSESIELRKKAMFWAGQSRHEMSDLIDLYDRLESRELKENLVFVYSQRRHDDAALDKLFEIARQEGDTQLRGKAIFWLGQSRDPRVIQFLAELIG